MVSAKRRKWNQQGKREAVIDVLTYLMSPQTPEQGQQCVETDAYARKLFQESLLGNIDVPNNVRLVFVPTGDRDKKDEGSVVIELPPLGGGLPADDDPMLVRYPKDFFQGPRKWDKSGKAAAIRDVLRHIISHPEVGQRCLENDGYVRRLFVDQGSIEVPEEVKAVFVPSGEEESKEFGSLVIELPKPGPVPQPHPNPAVPHPLLGYVLCCYNLWKHNHG